MLVKSARYDKIPAEPIRKAQKKGVTNKLSYRKPRLRAIHAPKSARRSLTELAPKPTGTCRPAPAEPFLLSSAHPVQPPFTNSANKKVRTLMRRLPSCSAAILLFVTLFQPFQ